MHEGHRSRLVGKIKDGSIVYEHELLEILLFNACPRRDLNATAHSLITRFGTIGGVLSATEEELCSVHGVGKNMAQYIICTGKELRRGAECTSFALISNTSQFRQFISNRYNGGNLVELFLMDKDGRLRRICDFAYGEGEGCGYGVPSALSQSNFLKCISVHRPYGLFAAVFREKGGCEPTAEDDIIAERISEVAALCGVIFYDFCISSGGDTYSYFVADRLMFGASEGTGGQQ